MDKPIKHRRFVKKPTKKQVVIVALAIILLLPALVAGYHEHRWQRYVEANNANYDDAKQRAAQLIALDAPSVESVDKTAVAIGAYTSAQCGNKPFLAAERAELLASAADVILRCEQRKQALADVQGYLDDLRKYLALDKQVAEAFNQASGKLKKIEQGDLASRKAVWETLERALSQISRPEGINTNGHDAQQKAVKQVIASYTDVLEADEAQRRSDYDQAIESLKASYKQLRATSRESNTVYLAAVEQLEQSIQSL